MSSENWQFYIEYWDPWPDFNYFEYSGKVLSFAGNVGRQSYMDQYSGSTFVVTVENNNDEAAQFIRGRYFTIYSEGSILFVSGRIAGIDYQDAPGENQGISTATVYCVDTIGQCGKLTLNDFVFPEDLTGLQAILPAGTFNQSVVPNVAATDTQSTASASTYSGTFLNKLNLLMNTEKGQMWPSGAISVLFLGRAVVGQPSGSTFVRNKTVVANEIPYVGFKRIQLGDQFMNQVLVQPESVASQFATNQDSIDLYGPSGYSLPTVDYDVDQAAGLGSWLATMQGDPSDYRYEITVTDISANKTEIQELLENLRFGYSYIDVEWLKPGDTTETTVQAVIEGFSYNAIPGETEYTFYLSSADFYQYFRLNDSVYGVLGAGGVYYDQTGITYNQSGYVYNDTKESYDASRLGW